MCTYAYSTALTAIPLRAVGDSLLEDHVLQGSKSCEAPLDELRMRVGMPNHKAIAVVEALRRTSGAQ